MKEKPSATKQDRNAITIVFMIVIAFSFEKTFPFVTVLLLVVAVLLMFWKTK